MKSALFLAVAALNGALALPSLAKKDDPFSNWQAAGPDDARAPCPMLNSLANHGFLPHSGRNITLENMETALNSYLNFNKSLVDTLFQFALTTVPTPNATTLDLSDLSRHNILEHDGSLSRIDAYYGDAHLFNEAAFDQTKAYFTSDMITLQQAADARLARMYTTNATNPTFNISDVGTLFSFGETAAYMIVFADETGETASREWVNYFFENERLPTSLGWNTPKKELTQEGLLDAVQRVELITGGSFPYPVPPAPAAGSKRAIHAGMSV